MIVMMNWMALLVAQVFCSGLICFDIIEKPYYFSCIDITSSDKQFVKDDICIADWPCQSQRVAKLSSATQPSDLPSKSKPHCFCCPI